MDYFTFIYKPSVILFHLFLIPCKVCESFSSKINTTISHFSLFRYIFLILNSQFHFSCFSFTVGKNSVIAYVLYKLYIVLFFFIPTTTIVILRVVCILTHDSSLSVSQFTSFYYYYIFFKDHDQQLWIIFTSLKEKSEKIFLCAILKLFLFLLFFFLFFPIQMDILLAHFFNGKRCTCLHFVWRFPNLANF